MTESKYLIVKGHDDITAKSNLLAAFITLWQRAKLENASKLNLILYNRANYTSLLIADFSRKAAAICIAHEDFEFQRAVTEPVKQAVLEFLNKILGQQGPIANLEEVEKNVKLLGLYFQDISRERNFKRQNQAGFFQGGNMLITSMTTPDFHVDEQQVKAVHQELLSHQLPITESQVGLLLRAEKGLLRVDAEQVSTLQVQHKVP